MFGREKLSNTFAANMSPDIYKWNSEKGENKIGLTID